MAVLSDMPRKWEITSPCMNPWAEQIRHEPMSRSAARTHMEFSSFFVVNSLWDSSALMSIRAILKACWGFYQGPGKCWSHLNSVLTPPQLLDVLEYLKWHWALVFCQTNVLGYKVLQWLFLPDFLQFMDSCLLYPVLTPALLTPVHRSCACVVREGRQTDKGVTYGCQLELLMFVSVHWWPEALLCAALFYLADSRVEET